MQNVPVQLFIHREQLTLQTKDKESITMTANWKKDVELEDIEIRHRI